MVSLYYDFFSALTISSSIFSSLIGILIVARSRENRSIHLPLVLFIFSSNIALFDIGFIMYTGNYLVFPHFLSISPLAIFTLGPLLYIYLVNLLLNIKSMLKALHFIPALLVFLILLPYLLKPGAEKVMLFEKFLSGELGFIDSLQYGTISIFGIIHMFVYHGISCILLLRYKRNVFENYSMLPGKVLSWVMSIAWSLLLSDILLAAAMLLSVHVFNNILVFYKTLVVVIPIFLNFLIFKILFMPELFFYGSGREMIAISGCYDESDTDPDLAQKIEAIIRNERLYKDMNLTLSELALRVDIPRTGLSGLINKYFNVNFYDFINKFRIEEVKRLIESNPEGIHILETATASGFKSKTTFNTCFKRFEKMTPTQYKQMILNTPKKVK